MGLSITTVSSIHPLKPMFNSPVAYTDTTIQWSEANPNWAEKPGPNMKYKACGSKPTTEDGGKTWKLDEIRVEQSVAPADYKPRQQVWGKSTWC